MKEEHYLLQAGKKLRTGYTTGSCAAAATKAALEMLLSEQWISEVILDTPKGIRLYLDVEEITREDQTVSCAIRKDGGDDPDVTHGMLVFSSVTLTDSGYHLIGGDGIGRITQPGFEQAIGSAAINKIPRQMIRKEVDDLCRKYRYQNGIEVTISIPGGEEVAKKTFNPHLGIVGGLSILGTSGIVIPMSEAALVKSIELEMDIAVAKGYKTLLICPGNYGETFSKTIFGDWIEPDAKCSNYVGETLDLAMGKESVEQILFVAHIGKFVKVAAGIMNTHSRNADARADVLAAHTAMVTEDIQVIRQVMNSLTTEEALEILSENALLRAVIERILERIQFYIQKRIQNQFPVGVILFSNRQGLLGSSQNAKNMIKEIKNR